MAKQRRTVTRRRRAVAANPGKVPSRWTRALVRKVGGKTQIMLPKPRTRRSNPDSGWRNKRLKLYEVRIGQQSQLYARANTKSEANRYSRAAKREGLKLVRIRTVETRN
jgi:hypothetical protein